MGWISAVAASGDSWARLMRTVFDGGLAIDITALRMMHKDWTDEREHVDDEGRERTCNIVTEDAL